MEVDRCGRLSPIEKGLPIVLQPLQALKRYRSSQSSSPVFPARNQVRL